MILVISLMKCPRKIIDLAMTQEEFFSRYQYDVATDLLGEGSFGKVFKAFDVVENKHVAIKKAEVKIVGNKRFSLQDEIKALENLPVHPNILRYDAVYTFKSQQGEFDYAVMPYYEGGNLKEYLAKNSLTDEEKESLIKQIGDGIAHLHENNIVHRDIKPSNILININKSDPEKTVVYAVGDNLGVEDELEIIPIIADFGLSKIAEPDKQTRFTASFGGGTLEYSSPEQLRGEKLRFNTDIWSFGVVVYEIYIGKPLFHVESTSTYSAERDKKIYDKIVSENVSPKLRELPTNIRQMVAACMERNPDKRVRTIRECFDILEPKVQVKKHTTFVFLIGNVKRFFSRPIIQIALIALSIISIGVLIDNPSIHNTIASIFSKNKNIDTHSEDSARMLDSLHSHEDDMAVNFDNWPKDSIIAYLKTRYKLKDIKDENEGMIMVEGLNEKWGFISKTGSMLIPMVYDDLNLFREGLAAVKLNEKWGFINKMGKVIIPIIYDEVNVFDKGGLAKVQLNGKYGFIDKLGTVRIAIKYDGTNGFNDDGYADVWLKRRQLSINRSGKEFDYVSDFKEGLAVVSSKGKYGFVNKSGEYIIPLIYNDASDFGNNLAPVKVGSKWGYINKLNNFIIPLNYDEARSFQKGLACVKLKKKYGYVDNSGQVIIPLNFDQAYWFSEGLALVEKENKLGYINEKGEIIIPIIYESAYYDFKKGLTQVKLNGKWFTINKKGQCVKNCPK